MRKYIFKTNSEDQRPVKHCKTTWVIVGVGYINSKPFWQMAIWLNEGEDVFEYYPEAYDVKVQLDREIEIKRCGDHHIVTCYKTLGFVDGIKYFDTEINPTLLAIIERMSYEGYSHNTIAKRAGINFNKFKKLCQHPMVIKAIEGGRSKFIEDLSKSL